MRKIRYYGNKELRDQVDELSRLRKLALVEKRDPKIFEEFLSAEILDFIYSSRVGFAGNEMCFLLTTVTFFEMLFLIRSLVARRRECLEN